MEDGRDDQAIERLSLAVSNDAQRWRAHNALGVFADRQGDHTKARSHYQVALTINPDAAHVHANAGYSHYLSGDFEAAIASLHSAANDRGFKAAWGNLATVYASQGRYEDAVVAFGKVMSDPNAYSATGKIAMKNGDLQAAFRLLTEAVNRSSTYFPEAVENLRKLKAQGVSEAPIHIASLRMGTENE